MVLAGLFLASGPASAPSTAQVSKTQSFLSFPSFPSNWDVERQTRLAELQAYLALNHDAFKSFRTAPLAIKQSVLNFVGIPVMMFRLFPEIFPDIWGIPAEKMANIGFGPDPFDPASVMPLGTGYALSAGFQITGSQQTVQVNYATLTCMGCHTGNVSKADGQHLRIIGAPTEIGNFFGAINKTVNDPRYTVANFQTALNAKPLGWVYGKPSMIAQEALERGLFNAPGGGAYFLGEVQFISNQSAQRIQQTAVPYTYNVPNPPPLGNVPGSLDVFTFAAASEADPSKLTPAQLQAAMPAAPAPSDIMGAWQQKNRPRYQWDDSIEVIAYREVAASLTVSAGDPASVNLANVSLAGQFVTNLPATPYPFDVNTGKAVRGQKIFQQACQSCHAPGNSNLMTPATTGTDPNRANVITSFVQTNLTAQLRSACTIPACFGPGGATLPDSAILQPTLSYASIPLAGVWATAPYLHNGSVPTLYHLITGNRPAKFYRANTTYDQKLVGFTWDRATSSRAYQMDTSQDGYSNAGHTGPQFNGGINWTAEPQKLEDLLEYLKTL